MLYLNDIPELLLATEFKTSMSIKASLEGPTLCKRRENSELNTTAKYMKAEILFVEDRVELAVPTQSRPTKIQNRELGVADRGSFK